MMKLRSLALTCCLLCPLVSAAAAPAYPQRTVRIVTAEAGGGTDFVSRILAQGLTARLKQQVIVDNRPSGAVQGDIVANANPDGHTLLLNGSNIWLAPFMQDGLPYDPIRDFAPVSLLTRSPNMLVAHPSVPAKTAAELIALAKARPGQLNYGSSAAGGASHLAAELFRSMGGIEVVRVPFRGTGPGLNALMGAQIQYMFVAVSAALPQVKAGRLKGLGISSAEPSALAPEYPPIAKSGLPGYESVAIYGIFAPVKTPAALVAHLHREIVEVMKSSEARDRLLASGAEPVASTPAEFGETVKREMNKWADTMRAARKQSE
jgi:tripartite-type tricarboxylate transporter receptor subunit TctC